MIWLTQFVQTWLRTESSLGKKLPEYPTEKDEVMVFQPRVEEAQRHARIEMKNLMEKNGKKGSTSRSAARGNKRRHDNMDAEEG